MCWYITSKFVVTVQRALRAKYTKDPPTDKTILVWYKQFTETGYLCKQKSSGCPLTAEDKEQVRASFLHSPKKSTATVAKELSMSKRAVWRVLHKLLVFKPYRIQVVQQLSDEDNLPYTYTTKNTQEVAEELKTIHFDEHVKIITLDIKDLYVNLPIQGILQTTKFWLSKHNTSTTIGQIL